MKILLIETIDTWIPGDCGSCQNMCYDAATFQHMDAKKCPLADAREAVEVHLGVPLTRSFEGKEVTRYDGNVVTLYAVKADKETK